MLGHKFLEMWFVKYILDRELHMNSFEFLLQTSSNNARTLQTPHLIDWPTPQLYYSLLKFQLPYTGRLV